MNKWPCARNLSATIAATLTSALVALNSAHAQAIPAGLHLRPFTRSPAVSGINPPAVLYPITNAALSNLTQLARARNLPSQTALSGFAPSVTVTQGSEMELQFRKRGTV